MFLCKLDIVDEIVRVLSVPYKATIVMQKESYTLSDFYACWHLMLRQLKKIRISHNKTDLAQNLLDKMVEREPQFFGNSAIVCALALDPRFCNQITELQKTIARECLIKLWQQIIDGGTNPSSDTSISDVDITIENTTLLMKYMEKPSDTEIVDISAALNTFMETKHKVDGVTIVGFWEENKTKYPELHKLAEVIFAISPTQAVVERSFSTLSYVFNSRRNQLSEVTLENILICSLNKDLFYSVNEDDKNTLIR